MAMAYAQAKQVDVDVIPVIDISPLLDGSDPKGVARALHAASQGLGFIYIKGHGIGDDVIEDARRCAFDFFRSPEADKRSITVSVAHRGWLGRGGAMMQDGAKADLKESFIWGYQDGRGKTPEDHPLRGANQWPDFVPDLQKHAMDYFRHAHDVAHHLMRGFALGLDLNETFFLQHSSVPMSRASFVYYPQQPEEMGEEQFGVGPHTDFGVLTVLCQDAVGGLQVENVDGEWIHAPPIEGTLIVNVGDLLSRWTDGAYKSTPHRVVNRSGKERLSLVLAFDPDPDTMIDARDVFGADHDAQEEAITCGDYLVWRFNKAFSYRKNKTDA
ncbi:MAG: isopenicillin N synthase family dioxygenase [Alphaproteobacteria bacterium]